MATYRSIEERKENLEKYNPSELKEKISTLYGSDSKVDKVVWELVPNYFKIKLPHLEILSIHLKTNEIGSCICIWYLVYVSNKGICFFSQYIIT